MKQLFLASLLSFSLLNGLLGQSAAHYSQGIIVDTQGNPFSGKALLDETADGKTQRHSIEVVNGIPHGEVVYFNASGFVEEKGHYAQGKKEGAWSQYSSQGSLLGEAYYKDGQKDGIWTVWDEKGIKRYHMVYSMGKKVDTWKMWDENSVLVSERTYNE